MPRRPAARSSPQAFLVSQDMAEQGGLARAEEARQDGAWQPGVTSGAAWPAGALRWRRHGNWRLRGPVSRARCLQFDLRAAPQALSGCETRKNEEWQSLLCAASLKRRCRSLLSLSSDLRMPTVVPWRACSSAAVECCACGGTLLRRDNLQPAPAASSFRCWSGASSQWRRRVRRPSWGLDVHGRRQQPGGAAGGPAGAYIGCRASCCSVDSPRSPGRPPKRGGMLAPGPGQAGSTRRGAERALEY